MCQALAAKVSGHTSTVPEGVLCVIHADVDVLCSPTSVHCPGAAAALCPLPQEAAGVLVCQCLL